LLPKGLKFIKTVIKGTDMKKIGIAIAFIILLAGIGSPFFSGMMMERVVTKSFKDINKMYADRGSDIALEIIRYDRKYMSSEIEWKINLGYLNTFYGINDIVLVEHADHSIFGVTAKTSLEKNKWFADWVANKLDGKNPLDIETRYEILGNIESTLSLKGFSLTENDEVIDILPAQLSVRSDMDFKKFTSHGSWDGLSVPEKLTVDAISFDSTIDKVSNYIWQGDTSITATQGTLDDDQNHVAFSNFKCRYNMDYDKEQKSLSIGMEYGIDSFKTQEDEISDAFIRLGINKMDAQGYEDFLKYYSMEMNNIMKKYVESQQTPYEMSQAMEDELLKIGPRLIGPAEQLLKKGLEIEIAGLKAQLPQGKIKGDLSLSLNKDMTMAQFIPIVMQPGAALDIFSLKSNLTLPSQLTGDNPALLAPSFEGMETGLFIKDGKNLIHTAETRDGKLFVNEKEVMLN
jgi:uncharacterized protein YdgA (DUF945 family)